MLPGWLALIVVGAIVLIAAYYLPVPGEVVAVLKLIGIVLLVFGAVLFLLAMLALAGVHLPG